jgi:hypothetical protein
MLNHVVSSFGGTSVHFCQNALYLIHQDRSHRSALRTSKHTKQQGAVLCLSKLYSLQSFHFTRCSKVFRTSKHGTLNSSRNIRAVSDSHSGWCCHTYPIYTNGRDCRTLWVLNGRTPDLEAVHCSRGFSDIRENLVAATDSALGKATGCFNISNIPSKQLMKLQT